MLAYRHVIMCEDKFRGQYSFLVEVWNFKSFLTRKWMYNWTKDQQPECLKFTFRSDK